ncbi:MAG: hypothetical protein ACP5OG_02565 [Candidatus Nanoarchaeia archaeon]
MEFNYQTQANHLKDYNEPFDEGRPLSSFELEKINEGFRKYQDVFNKDKDNISPLIVRHLRVTE